MAPVTQKILETHVVGPMQCNCSIFACPTSKEAIVVDPGGDADVILDRIAKLGLKVRYVLITHGHFDHVLAARDIKEKTGAEVCLHRKDIWLYRITPLQARIFGAKGIGRRPPRPDWLLGDGDQIPVGGYHADVLHTPGHSPGSCCFHVAEEKLLFSGDTLFAGSVGQWEYPGGSFEPLVRSITEKLFVLPDDTYVIPGHGEHTTIGDEKINNIYFKSETLARIRHELSQKPGKMKMLWLMIRSLVGLDKS